MAQNKIAALNALIQAAHIGQSKGAFGIDDAAVLKNAIDQAIQMKAELEATVVEDNTDPHLRDKPKTRH